MISMQASQDSKFIEYINSFPSNTLILLTCPQCNSIFYRKKNIIQSKLGKHNAGKTIYCSSTCCNKSKIKLIDVKCIICNKLFKRDPNQIKRSLNNFCSHKCSAIYNNAHKTKGTRRSKLEIWLESQLSSYYPSLIIDYNKSNTINAELDIYIPCLKIAFELNGIFHYEPIFGDAKLASTKNNDARKFQACLEQEIELIIIDSSREKYFKPKNSIKYFEIIKSIIDRKLL